MTGQAIVAELKNLEPIEGADKIVSANLFGETVIVSKDHKEGDLGILFDCETQLSHEFCYENNLYRHCDLNKDKSKEGYIEDNRRVRPIRLKGVRCSGFWMPIESVKYAIEYDLLEPPIGFQFNELNGHEICKKYISQKTKNAQSNKKGKAKENLVPTFKEHFDTDQFMRNQHLLKPGQLMIITEKLHGTSCRVGYLQEHVKMSLFTKIIHFIGTGFRNWPKHASKYSHIVGSRRVVKLVGNNTLKNQSYYNSDIWSLSAEQFRDKLEKGETVYYEIVGYLPDGGRIMPEQSNEKLKKFMSKAEYKEFTDKYGPTTSFNYGCGNLAAYDRNDVSQHKVFVYRITTTNEDGHTIDYSWDQVKTRCEQLGVEHVPELSKILVTQWENTEDHRDNYMADQYGNKLEKIVEIMAEEDSDVFPDHIREGVCVRIENGGLTPKILTQKAYLFKVLEGIVKDSNIIDLEEQEG